MKITRGTIRKTIFLPWGIILVGLLVVVAAVSMTGSALALQPVEPGGPGGPAGGANTGGGGSPSQGVDVSTVGKTVGVINNVANALAVILFALSAIFIIISAIFYLTAAGNQEQLKRAKDTLIYAIVGIVLGLIAFGVDNLTESILKQGA